jgi:hypothetical protein
MEAAVLVEALTGVVAFAAAVAVGVCMVLCARSHFTRAWQQVRRLLCE